MPFAKLKRRSQRVLEISPEHMNSAVEQYLWSMRLIKDSEKVQAVSDLETSKNWIIQVGKEV